MAEEEFDSLDAIEKHFGKLKKQAGDDADAVKSLMLEEREAKADFRERSAVKRELDAHRKALLAGSDLPEEAQALVAGNTIEELDASLAKITAMADKLRSTASGAAADKLYGDPIRPGGGTPPPPRTSDEQKFTADFEKRWNNKEQVTVQEIRRYVETLGGAHMLVGLANNSQHFQRRGVGKEVADKVAAGKN